MRTAKIDVTNVGQFHLVGPYAIRHPSFGDKPLTREQKAANAEVISEIESQLRDAGFRLIDRGWWSKTCEATINSSDDLRGIGVTIHCSPTLAAFRTHKADGTYDALPLAEKHRLSGAGGTIEAWLRLFDQCGKPRPGDGCA
jgi:hypothetical protein